MILTLEGLSKRFVIHHLHREVVAFEGLCATLRTGQFLLVQGRNGVGKSTLLRCLYRSYLPSAGKACYHAQGGAIDLATAADIDISHLRRREIGFVSQFLRVRPRVSALELVAEPLLAAGWEADAAQTEAAHSLEAFGLKCVLWPAYPSTFSGGEQQKVNLARALIHPRRLLLLDEPTASLDAGARAALVARLSDLKSQGVSMIGVFHHPDDVQSLIDDTLELPPPAAPSEHSDVAH